MTVLPLDETAAAAEADLLHRAKWQVTIERPMGISFNTRRHEETREGAVAAALLEFYERHPQGLSESVRVWSKSLEGA